MNRILENQKFIKRMYGYLGMVWTIGFIGAIMDMGVGIFIAYLVYVLIITIPLILLISSLSKNKVNPKGLLKALLTLYLALYNCVHIVFFIVFLLLDSNIISRPVYFIQYLIFPYYLLADPIASILSGDRWDVMAVYSNLHLVIMIYMLFLSYLSAWLITVATRFMFNIKE